MKIMKTTVSSREAFRRLLVAEIDASGLFQSTLAARVGITPKHLSQMITGKVGLNFDIVDRLLVECGRRLVLATVPNDEVIL